jgi:putative MATE family efflux protein
MRIAAGVVGLNIVLDPLLIFGPGPIPRMEVLGAAVATVTAHAIGVLLFLRHFHRHRAQFPGIPRHIFRVDPRTMLALAQIGAPSSVNAILFSVVYIFLSREAAAIGTGPLAALGIANRVESISFLTASSIAVAAATMVGQNLGAGERNRATRAAVVAMWIGVAVCSFWGIGFFVLAGPIVGLFSRDATVIGPGSILLRLIAICQPLMGVEIALMGAFRGAGYTFPPMAISSSISVLRIPLARFSTVTLHAGIAGIGWVISLTCAFRALCMLGLLRVGRWSSAGTGV